MHILNIDFNDPDAAEKFLDSIHSSGFAVIRNHPVDVALIEKNYLDWQVFFQSDDKYRFPFNKEMQTGYVPFRTENSIYQKELKNLSEFFNYYPWGSVPETLKDQTLDLHGALVKTATILLGWLDRTLPGAVRAGFPMPLVEMIQGSPKHLLRIINYPAITGDEKPGEIRTSRHEDSNLITLLPCPTRPGLQIEDKRGQWHDVRYTKEDMVINIGAQSSLLTQNYLPSTFHRVINPETTSAGNGARMSMPLFLHPRDEVRLTDGISAGEFLHDYLIRNGIK